ncbi:hypothetical protein LAZ67_22000537 [Cordylochernes scorpioides]|uniref:Uncharacterized protein n=1 Tax=Cordylochernes scorpioides TaxID=51811 RepID=A0ABY6LQ37_9ARAC|nr:hypothetical protein LAZ67_22000537 [Cordylochernes scorpioides]
MTMLALTQLERPKRCWKTSNGKFSHIHLIFRILPQATSIFSKLHLGGKHFANDDEVQAEANHWLRRQDTAWYNSGIKKLLQRYQKCLDRNGDYVERTTDVFTAIGAMKEGCGRQNETNLSLLTSPASVCNTMMVKFDSGDTMEKGC